MSEFDIVAEIERLKAESPEEFEAAQRSVLDCLMVTCLEGIATHLGLDHKNYQSVDILLDGIYHRIDELKCIKL